jgi:hypothetical protein
MCGYIPLLWHEFTVLYTTMDFFVDLIMIYLTLCEFSHRIIFCQNHPNKSQNFFFEALREVFNAADCQFGVDVVVVAQALEQTGSSKEIFEIHDMKAIDELKHR